MVNGYFANTLAEALQLRADHSVIPYAGGTDLMVENRPEPAYLFIGGVPELRGITDDGEYIRIGAAVTFTQALESDIIPAFLKEAVSRIAAPAIRNAGTFGGNIGNGSAKADSALIFFAADARLRLASVRGERVIGISEFYLGRKKLDLADDELIVEILLSKAGLDNYYYKKVGARSALAISRVSFAGLYGEENGVITRFSAAFGAVSGTVLRFKDIESTVTGKTVDEVKSHKKELLRAYSERMVLTQGRVSADYRKAVCMNLLNDFLTQKGI